MSKLTAGVAICIDAQQPAHLLAKIGNQTALEHMIDRLRECCTEAAIVLCTSNHSSSTPAVDIARKKRIQWHTSACDDPVAGMLKAAELSDADVIVRIAGGNILVDARHIDLLVRRHVEAGADCSRTAGLPKGAECEVISADALRKARNSAADKTSSHCILQQFNSNEPKYRVQELLVEERFRRDYRLALEHPDDLAMLRELFSNLHEPGRVFSLEQVIQFLDDHPEYAPQMNHDIERGAGFQPDSAINQQPGKAAPHPEPAAANRTYPIPLPTHTATLPESGYIISEVEERLTATMAQA